MNRYDKLALVAVVVVTILVVLGASNVNYYSYYTDQIPDGKWPIWAAGWITATYGPITISVLSWRWAKKVSVPWALHLMFFPAAVAALRAGEALMLSVMDDPDFDAMLGAAVMPATILFFFAISSYLAALIGRKIFL